MNKAFLYAHLKTRKVFPDINLDPPLAGSPEAEVWLRHFKDYLERTSNANSKRNASYSRTV